MAYNFKAAYRQKFCETCEFPYFVDCARKHQTFRSSNCHRERMEREIYNIA